MTDKDLETRILDEEEFNDSLLQSMKYYAEKAEEYQKKYKDCLELYDEIDWYKGQGYRIIYKKDKDGLYFEFEKRQIGFKDEKE